MRKSASAMLGKIANGFAVGLGAIVASIAVALGTLFLLFALGLPSLPSIWSWSGITAGGMVFPRRQTLAATGVLAIVWALTAVSLWFWSETLDVSTYMLFQILQGCGLALSLALVVALVKRRANQAACSEPRDNAAG